MVYCSTAQTQEDWRFPFLSYEVSQEKLVETLDVRGDILKIVVERLDVPKCRHGDVSHVLGVVRPFGQLTTL